MKKTIDIMLLCMFIISTCGVTLLYVGNKEAALPILVMLTSVPVAFSLLLAFFKIYTRNVETELDRMQFNNTAISRNLDSTLETLIQLRADIISLSNAATARVRGHAEGEAVIDRGIQTLEYSREVLIARTRQIIRRDELFRRHNLIPATYDEISAVRYPTVSLDFEATFEPKKPEPETTVIHETKLEL